MKILRRAFLVSISLNVGFLYADNIISGSPDWSTPARGEASEMVDSKVFSLPDSIKKYTQAEVDNKFEAPDWRESDHAPMPAIVKFGKKPKVWACASCHLSTGAGHPESSRLAGLTADYIIQQLNNFSDGSRLDYSGHMNRMAPLMTKKEKTEAANWFASLKPNTFIDVIETDSVPVTYVDDTRMRLVVEGGGLELINGRIIEVPENIGMVKLRAPEGRFLSYVPKGAILRGKQIVTTGGGKVAPCTACHGVDLRGTSIAPSLAGNFASYTVRQLHGFKSGVRASVEMAPMASGLNDNDIVDVAAYLASLNPGPLN